jgi:hypothetical protein
MWTEVDVMGTTGLRRAGPVAMKAAAARENVRPGERASVAGSPGMGLAG